MARLYADEDFDLVVVTELRRLGHDVLTVSEAGRKRDADPLVLAFAVQNGRAVITFNRRHFLRLHRHSRPHRGIVICTRDPDRPALAMRIHTAIQTLTTMDNVLLRVTRPPVP